MTSIITTHGFRMKNRHRDDFVDFGVYRDAVGFEKRLVAYTDVKRAILDSIKVVDIILTLLYFGWIYRSVFNHSTGRTECKVIKLIYLNRPSNENMGVASE